MRLNKPLHLKISCRNLSRSYFHFSKVWTPYTPQLRKGSALEFSIHSMKGIPFFRVFQGSHILQLYNDDRQPFGGPCCYYLNSGSWYPLNTLYLIANKNFTGATFVLATHEEGSFSSTSLSGDMKIFFIENFTENVGESPILNSWEFSHVANVNIAWQRLCETVFFGFSLVKAVIDFLVTSLNYLLANIWRSFL